MFIKNRVCKPGDLWIILINSTYFLVSALTLRSVSYLVIAGTLATLQVGCNRQQPGGPSGAISALNSKPISTPVATSPATQAAALVEPAVVTVHTVGHPLAGPTYQEFFGEQSQTQTTPRGAGSGVIISDDGYIMTNDHVVADAVTVTVDVNDKPYTATVVGRDPVSDFAVVKIDTKGLKLTPAKLG